MNKRQYANMFREAANIVSKGWHQGLWFQQNSHGWCYCVAGALNLVSGDSACLPNQTSYAMYKMVEELLNITISNGWARLAEWNDYPVRRQEHVVEILRHAAARLDHGWTPICWDSAKNIKPLYDSSQT